VNFSAADSSASGGIESYQWRIDGGTILTGSSIEVAFAVPGSHEVVVEVTGANGNTSVERRTIQVAAGNDSTVSVSQRNATYATATVEGSGFRQQVRAANGPLAESENLSLDRLSATFPEETTVDMTFSVAAASPPGLGETGLGVFTITHSNVTAEEVSLRFGVNRTVLNRTGASPSDVTLYRNEGNWSALETTVVSRGASTVVYESSSPGLSQFAVGVTATETEPDSADEGNETSEETTPEPTNESGESSDGSTTEPAPAPTGSPDIVVTNVTVNESSPNVGENVSINVTASNRGTAAGNYSVAVVLNNSTLATHEMAVRPGATTTQEFVHQMPEAGALAVDGQQVANVSSGGGLLSILPGPVSGIFSALPNPLALWPDGIVGTILGGLIGLIVVTYAILKALAIYLGY
jgi:hypothetical protein